MAVKKETNKGGVLSTILQLWSKTQEQKDVEARELKFKSLQASAELLITTHKNKVNNAKVEHSNAIADAEKLNRPEYDKIFQSKLKLRNEEYLLDELIESYKEDFGVEPKI